MVVPTVAPQQIRLPTVLDLHNQAGLQAIPAAATATQQAASAAPHMSALAAVQRVRRMMAESNERKKKLKEEQENECVICLDRPMSTVLQPCGHVQMCSRCCRELLAIAESKSVEPQVSCY